MWVLTVLGAASSAGSTGVSISVEREAVKALCGADGRALGALNSVMRAIDLTALLCAPLAAGLLMTAAGPFAAAAVMAGYCSAAFFPEVALLRAAFRAAPVLGWVPGRRCWGGFQGAGAGVGYRAPVLRAAFRAAPVLGWVPGRRARGLLGLSWPGAPWFGTEEGSGTI